MRFNKLILMSFFLPMLAACASQGSVADEPQEVDVRIVEGKVDPTTAGGEDPNEVVCTRRHQVGTNFPRTVCKKRSEWDRDRADAQRQMQQNRARDAARRVDSSKNF